MQPDDLILSVTYARGMGEGEGKRYKVQLDGPLYRRLKNTTRPGWEKTHAAYGELNVYTHPKGTQLADGTATDTEYAVAFVTAKDELDAYVRVKQYIKELINE